MRKIETKGIKSFGVYIPRSRMSRTVIAEANSWALPRLEAIANGEKSFCNWDEDVITMSVEAVRSSLQGFSIDKIGSIDLASTSAPYSDNQNSTIVAAALNAQSNITCADFSGSTRSGLTSLIRALDQSYDKDRVVVAAENRHTKPGSVQEMTYGAGAVALLLGEGDEVIASVLGSESLSVPFIDHFRKSQQKYDYVWEERWIRDEGITKLVPDCINRLMTKIECSIDKINYFGFYGGPAGSDERLAKIMAIPNDSLLQSLDGVIGDLGSAHPFLQLSQALEKARDGDLIVIACFASGCEAIALKVNKAASNIEPQKIEKIIAVGIAETAYTKLLSHSGEIELDWGMRAELNSKMPLTALYRCADQILGFIGGKCQNCATVQFPSLHLCVNCGANNTQKPFPLSDESAKVATYTADWLMFTPSPPLYVGLVQFDIGARLLMEFVDVDSARFDVGTPLEMVFRIKERDKLRHFDRYFWKARPIV